MVVAVPQGKNGFKKFKGEFEQKGQQGGALVQWLELSPHSK